MSRQHVSPAIHEFVQRCQICAGMFSLCAYPVCAGGLWSVLAQLPADIMELHEADALTAVTALRRLSQGFFRCSPFASPIPPISTPERRVNDVLCIIRTRYATDGLTLRNIADELRVTRCYLSRLLRWETGHSFPTHVNGVRLLAAVEVLSSAERVKEAARLAGYSSTGELDRQFKRRIGLTPKRFASLATACKRRPMAVALVDASQLSIWALAAVSLGL